MNGSIFVSGKYTGLPEKSRPNKVTVDEVMTMEMFALLRECGKSSKYTNIATLIAKYGNSVVEKAMTDGYDLHLQAGEV
jgi:hypothetical protein